MSPLLANIALNGIEDIHQSVRYADDMVVILKPKDDAIKILDQISPIPRRKRDECKPAKNQADRHDRWV